MASLAAALAVSPAMLIGCRLAQGAAISQSLEIRLGIAAVLFVLALALPRRPRDPQPAETEPDATTTSTRVQVADRC